MISAQVGQSGELVILSDAVLAHFDRYRQTRFWQREAGGLLFARIVDDTITIDEATGPRKTDWRTRYSYRGDPRAEQREIDARFPVGLHYVGDWHTHPERAPSPSVADNRAMVDRFVGSRHELHSLLFIIVGTSPFPEGLALAVHDGAVRLDLDPHPID